MVDGNVNIYAILEARRREICERLKRQLQDKTIGMTGKSELEKSLYMLAIQYIEQSLRDICGGGE